MKKCMSKTNLSAAFCVSCMVLLFLFPVIGGAEEINCILCHDQLTKGRSVHAAVKMGCATCHTAIDANTVPHKLLSKTVKGLSAEVPDLCFGCHNKAEFSRTNVHMPVAGGMCLSCHKAHASDNPYLLVKGTYDVCLDCHADMQKRPHVLSVSPGKGHPLGRSFKDEKTGQEKTVMDPNRPDKPFYCASCHPPHASNYRKLLRFESTTAFDICTHCHKK